MNTVFEAAELAASFVEALLCYYFIQLFFPEKTKGGLRFVFLALILLVTVRAAEKLGVYPFLTTLWFVFYICLTTVIIFNVDGFYAVSLVSFYILCVYIIDFFCISVMGVLLKNGQFAHMVLEQLSLWRVAYQAADKLLLVLFYFLVRRAMRRELVYNAGLLFLVSCLGLVGVGFLSWLTIQETGIHALFSWSLFLILLMFGYFVLLFYSRYVVEQRQRLALQMKDEMTRKEYDLMVRQQKEQAELSHDMKNHLLVLSSMLEENKTEEAKRYIGLMQEPLSRLEIIPWTGNQVLDTLLNHARNRANENGIHVTIQTDAVHMSRMDDKDVCCLFANLLDNAVEAAKKAGTAQNAESRWIHIKLRKAGEMVFLELANSSAAAPEKKGKYLVTSKAVTAGHGLGIKSAERVVQKYDGTMEYEYGEGVFTVSVTFFSGMA